MPGFDKTGPEGEGPMTGRRLGRCAGYGAKQRKMMQTENPDEPSEDLKEQGFLPGTGGRGFGRGRGMGFRHRFRGGW